MKRIILTFITTLLIVPNASAFSLFDNSDDVAIKKVLKSQERYANNTNLKKLISTYDKDYVSGDGLTLEAYTKLVNDIWNTYKNIEYNIEVKKLTINNDEAVAEVTETSTANVIASQVIPGKLNTVSNSTYYLKKTDRGWKVVSDRVVDETTSLLYGDALDLDIKLTVPSDITPNTEYTASLEFKPPANSLAIASITSDVIEYPQAQTEEVFRTLPDDNILERLFTSNNRNLNEYIIASIGLTKTAIDDLSVKLSLTGFGYYIKRVNVKGATKGGFKSTNVTVE